LDSYYKNSTFKMDHRSILTQELCKYKQNTNILGA